MTWQKKHAKTTAEQWTYHSELIECFEQLICQFNILRCDIGINQIEKLSRFSNDIE